MIQPIYNQVQYIPSHTLENLNTTYDTLQKGHDAAIKAASDLEVAVANLDLNEEEAGFRQGVLNSIQQTIDDNTTQNNSYKALNKIVKQYGDIFKDPQMITKLKAQKDYTKYLEDLKNAKMPEHYKDYYRKKNTYDGASQYNADGSFKLNYKWTPKENYTEAIDANTVMDRAFQVAARKKGGSTIRNNDGTYETLVGSKWEILTRDDLANAIRDAFNNTSGMDASLHQDYKIAIDDLENGNSNNEHILDANGNVRNFDAYIDDMINKYADRHDYSYVYSDKEYAVHPPSNTKVSNSNNSSGISDQDVIQAHNQMPLHITGTSDFQVNTYGDSIKNQKSAGQSFAQLINKPGGVSRVTNPQDLINFIKKRNPNATITGPGTALNAYFNMINSKTGKPYKEAYSPEERAMIYLAADTWGRETYNQNQLRKSANNNGDENSYNFAKSIANGEFVKGNSTYDDDIIEINNYLFDGVNTGYFKGRYGSSTLAKESAPSKNGNLTIQVPEKLYEVLSSRYNSGQLPNFISTQRLDNGDWNLIINSKDRNGLAEFSRNLNLANDQYSSFWYPVDWIYGTTRMISGSETVHVPRYKVIDDNGNEDGKRTQLISAMADVYSNGLNNSNKVLEKYDNYATNGRTTQFATMYGSETEAYCQEFVNMGKMTQTEADRRIKNANNRLDNAFANDASSLGFIKERNGNNFEDVDDKIEVQSLIKQMYSNPTFRKQVSREYGPFRLANTNDGNKYNTENGYYLSFTVPKGITSNKYKEGDVVQFFVSGTKYENSGFSFATSTAANADNALECAKQINTYYKPISYNNYLGNTDIIKSKTSGKPNTFDINIFGRTLVGADEKTTRDYLNNLFTIQRMKSMYQDEPNNVEFIYTNTVPIATYINNLIGGDANTLQVIYDNIINYIGDDTVE